LKHTIDYAHSKNVKFGIWLLRGINRRAVEQNLPVEGTKYRMKVYVWASGKPSGATTSSKWIPMLRHTVACGKA
jgi:hypothetical protein